MSNGQPSNSQPIVMPTIRSSPPTQSPHSVRIRTVTEILHPAAALPSLLESLRVEKRTGKLIIHISNGSPSGYVEWSERKEEI